MKILDNVKGMVEKAISPKIPSMNACMMGARGVGKSSVLVSMFYDLNSVNQNTNLQLVTVKDIRTNDNSTEEMLVERYKELMNIFTNSDKSEVVMNSGMAGDFETREYNFQFGMKGRKPEMDLKIKDFPGEFIKDFPDDVKSFIDESEVVIIAIDTPHMIEYGGVYCEAKNCCSVITDLMKQVLSGLKDDKLILFVPLKCEKYYHEDRMDEVTQSVERCYADLIDYIKNGSAKLHIACAVTPILTVGEIDFKDFMKDKDGNIKTIGDDHVPAKAIYSFVGKNAHYASKYCEQPLCYLLSFVTKLYQRSKSDENGSFLKKLSAIFKLFPDDPALLHEVSKFAQKKMINRDGFKIISGNAIL